MNEFEEVRIDRERKWLFYDISDEIKKNRNEMSRK